MQAVSPGLVYAGGRIHAGIRALAYQTTREIPYAICRLLFVSVATQMKGPSQHKTSNKLKLKKCKASSINF